MTPPAIDARRPTLPHREASALALPSSCLLVLTLVGCGPRPAAEGPAAASEPAPRPVVSFPTTAHVQQVVEAGPPPDIAPLLPEGEVAVDRWDLRATGAPADPVYEGEGPFEAWLDEATESSGRSVQRSASLRCVAQEIARFHTQHEALPTERLSRHLLAACGSSAVDVRRTGTLGRADPRTTDEALAREAGPAMREMIASALVDGARVGLAVHREGPAVSVIVVVATPKVELAPPTPPGADSLAIVRGRLLADADAAYGLVNQGRYGVARCRVTPGFALPQLELRCPIAEGDEHAVVEINTLTLGNVLSDHVATVMVQRTPGAPLPPFAPQPVGEPAVVTDPAAAGPTMVARLNEVRSAEGLGPVTLAAQQSATSQRVAPYMLASLLQGQQREQNVLALGMLAGWQVEGGTIRWGDLVGQVTVGTNDVAEWLAATLEQPGGRWVLMRDDVGQLAVGALPVAEPQALGLVASTYAFFEGVDHRADAQTFFERVAAARAHRGLPPPVPMRSLDALWAQADAVSAGQAAPAAALQRGLEAESQAQRRSLRGYLLETIDMQLGEIPAPMLEQRELSLGVAVAHTRAPDAAWGQYAVMVIFGG